MSHKAWIDLEHVPGSVVLGRVWGRFLISLRLARALTQTREHSLNSNLSQTDSKPSERTQISLSISSYGPNDIVSMIYTGAECE